MLVTTRDVLAETPSKIYQELQHDLSDPKTVGKVALVSTGLGFGTTALLTKAPKVGGYILGGLALYQGVKYGINTLDFLGEASHADTDFRRKLLVERASTGLGREGATMIEYTPGLIAGGALAAKTVGTPPAFKAIGSWSERTVGQPMKSAAAKTSEFVAEQWNFRGPRSMSVPSHLLTEEGKVNALELSEMLSSRHPWNGVETARSVDLLKMRVSRPFTEGKATTVDPGFIDKPGRVLFHTHGPDAAIGTRPGTFDIQATQDLGIIARGKQTAFYAGQGREYNLAVASGAEKAFAPKLQALVLDAERQSAFVLDTVWQPKLGTWQPSVPRFVDYKTARAALTKFDITKPGLQFEQLPTLPSIRGQNIDWSALNWLPNKGG